MSDEPPKEVEEARPMSATNLMILAMEDFGEIEPEAAVVIYRNSSGCVVFRSNAPPVESIGLLELAKATLIAGMLSDGGGEGDEGE
jgi:hypothetical protein